MLNCALAALCPKPIPLMCQELLEAEAANSKAIEDVIEEERAKVDARTPITEEVRPLMSCTCL